MRPFLQLTAWLNISAITRHDLGSNEKRTSSTEHCCSVKQEYAPNSKEVRKCLCGLFYIMVALYGV